MRPQLHELHLPSTHCLFRSVEPCHLDLYLPTLPHGSNILNPSHLTNTGQRQSFFWGYMTCSPKLAAHFRGDHTAERVLTKGCFSPSPRTRMQSPAAHTDQIQFNPRLARRAASGHNILQYISSIYSHLCSAHPCAETRKAF